MNYNDNTPLSRTTYDRCIGNVHFYFGSTCNTSPSANSAVRYTIPYSYGFSGFKNPWHLDQVSRHVSATTSFSATKFTTTRRGGDLKATKKMDCGTPLGVIDMVQTVSGDLIALSAADFSLPSLPSASLRNVALSRFYSQAYQALSPVQGGVILAELHKTLHQLRHPFTALRGLFDGHHRRVSREVKRLRGRHWFTQRADLLQAIRDSWLEFQFGVKPTLSDIDSIITTMIDRKYDLGRQFVKVVGDATEEVFESDSTYLGTTGASVCVWNEHRVQSVKRQVRFSGEVNLSVVSHENVTFRTSLDYGVNPLNFVPTLYELIPYSWLVDYFTNVGSVLSSFSVPRASIAWVCENQRSSRVVTYGTTPYRSNSGWGIAGNAGEASVHSTRVLRREGSTFELPDFAFNPRINLTRLLNISAVALQFRGLEKSFTKLRI